jgi:hypothetical protein
MPREPTQSGAGIPYTMRERFVNRIFSHGCKNAAQFGRIDRLV